MNYRFKHFGDGSPFSKLLKNITYKQILKFLFATKISETI